jgi:serine/threonine-protein kinase
MAPERFTGGRVGPQSDIYSLACLLYECLTGWPPFPPGDLTHLMSAHMLAAPPRPSAARPGLNPAFDEIIARGMAKQPEARYAAAGALARDATSAAALSQAPTAMAPHRDPPPGTRAFPAQWPNPAGTGYTPYPPVARAPVRPVRTSAFGRGPLVLASVAGALLLAALIGVVWMAFGPKGDTGNTNVAVPQSESTTTRTTVASTSSATSTPSRAPTTSTVPAGALPGTDSLGFTDIPGARCDPGNPPAALGRTAKSVVVVCQAGPGNYYYRGVRLSDNAGIELANAVRSSGGFDVTNPSDGTRYQVRPNVLTIIGPNGQVESEPMVDYAAS